MIDINLNLTGYQVDIILAAEKQLPESHREEPSAFGKPWEWGRGFDGRVPTLKVQLRYARHLALGLAR
jgi:hypothetical protein